MSVEQRLKNLKMRIQEACQRSARTENSVRLLAVSKLQDEERIREAAQCGQTDFAENYVQEATAKITSLDALELRWHFIGRIQSNKLKFLIGKYFAIHAIDRLSIAQQLNRLCAAQGILQNIFLQFNVAQEDSKGGADEVELEQLFDYARRSSHLRILGLMVMPPLNENPELTRPYFKKARETLKSLALRLSEEEAKIHPWNELSMGTSLDFTVAIEEGATWVRIGTEVFGPRPTPQEGI